MPLELWVDLRFGFDAVEQLRTLKPYGVAESNGFGEKEHGSGIIMTLMTNAARRFIVAQNSLVWVIVLKTAHEEGKCRE